MYEMLYEMMPLTEYTEYCRKCLFAEIIGFIDVKYMVMHCMVEFIKV